MEEDVKRLIYNIFNSTPKDITPLEKVRWFYIKIGDVFSYNNLIRDNNEEVHFDSPTISKYQTSYQISTILNELLNKMDPNIKSEVVNNEGNYSNRISIDDKSYLIDLTNDLYRIQTDLKTKEFGISDSELESIDKKLKLYNYGYTDDKINDLNTRLSFKDFSNNSFEEEVDFRMDAASVFIPQSISFFEGDKFISNEIIDKLLIGNVDRYVLRNDKELKSVYLIHKNGEVVTYIFDKKGLNKSSILDIENLLSNGWVNNNLKEFIDSQSINKKNR